MKTRLVTSLYIVIALIALFVSKIFTPYAFDILFGLLAVIGAVEIARVLERLGKNSHMSLVSLYPALAYVALYYGFETRQTWEYYLLMFLGVFVVFFIVSLTLTLALKSKTEEEINKLKTTSTTFKYAIDKAFNTSFILIYPTLLFSALFFLNHLNELPFINSDSDFNNPIISFFFLATTIIITTFSDSLAMLVGKYVKGPRPFPIISPNKTVSGYVGGLIGGVAGALLIYYVFSFSHEFTLLFNSFASIWFVVFLGVFATIACQAGDLLASYLKRKARVKDFGTIFPGHGGVMDRVDGLIFTSLFVFVSVVFLFIF